MENKNTHSRFPLLPASLLSFLLVVFVSGAWYYYHVQQKLFERKAGDELRAVASLKTSRIVDWRSNLLAQSDVFCKSLLAFLPAGPLQMSLTPALLGGLECYLSAFRNDFGYNTVFVTDSCGRIIAQVRDGTCAKQYVDTVAVRAAVRNRVPRMADFYKCPVCGKIHIDVVNPLLIGDPKRSTVVAVAVLRTDPEKFLLPLIESWPTISKTAETLILRRDGDSIVYLNELRHRSGTSLQLKFPLSAADLPASRVASGQEGFMEGTDYRGVHVFAAGRRIPGSPWYIVSKVDKEEVNEPLLVLGRHVFVVSGLLIVLTVTLLFLLWVVNDRRILEKQVTHEIDRRNAEDALKASEEKYHFLFQNMVEGFAYCRMFYNAGRPVDFQYLNVNATFETLTGLKDVAGKMVSRVIPGIRQSDPDLFETYGRVALSGKPERFETYVQAMKMWFSISVYSPQKEYFVAMFDVITDRKQTEEALGQSLQRLRRFYEASLIGVMYWNMDGKITDANDKFLDMVGYSREDLERGAIDWVHMTPPEYKHFDERSTAELKNTGVNKVPFEKEYLRKNGTRMPILVAGAMLDETRFNGVAFVLDITDRKRAENQIHQLNNELLQKNAELEQLVYVASHDLRSPLVNVQGFSKEMGLLANEIADIASNAILPEKQKSRLADIVSKEFPESQNYILASVIKMDALLKGLLKLSRLGRAALVFREINMNDLLAGVVKNMEYKIKEGGIRVEVAALPACTGDPDQLCQVFTNLLDNAVKYLRPDIPGVILITCRTIEGGLSEFCVEDNGIGIAPQYQAKAFEIFHRLTPKMCEGEGLGLAIVKKIALRLNGSVRLESEEGKGCRFFVSLPGA